MKDCSRLQLCKAIESAVFARKFRLKTFNFMTNKTYRLYPLRDCALYERLAIYPLAKMTAWPVLAADLLTIFYISVVI